MTAPENSQLVERIRSLILEQGAIPFDRYMSECLYAPELGYYAKSQSDPGRHSDFYTSVSVGPLFGRLLADQMTDLWSKDYPNEPLIIIEQGCHGGQLALDILETLRSQNPIIYNQCLYYFLEPQTGLRQQQQQKLRDHAAHTRWILNLSEIALIKQPCFFLSNELVDSFPIKSVTYENNFWKESYVTWDPLTASFVEFKQTICTDALLKEISHWHIPEIDGYRAEINLQARAWMQELGQFMESGFILTIDYGFAAPELFSIEKRQGTLACYRDHHRDDNPFEAVGEKDITAHINFSLLMEEGLKNGWEVIFFEDQHRALIKSAKLKFLQEVEERLMKQPTDKHVKKEIRQFQTLTHPGIMGRQFKFLIQKKVNG